jgi:hypothetical protein
MKWVDEVASTGAEWKDCGIQYLRCVHDNEVYI